MSYELDSIEYKGFTIRIVHDEDADEPDWGDDEVFITNLRKKYRFGQVAQTGPESHLEWGEGPWGEWNELLAQHGVKTPPESWNTTVASPELGAAYDLYQEWKEDHDMTYLVWPYHCGDAHGPGTFCISVIDTCNWERADGWIYVKHPGTPLEQLANLEFNPEKMRDGLIKVYEEWANGDIWGFIIQNSDGEEVEDGSCWGYYGSDDCIEQAKEAADRIAPQDRVVEVIVLLRPRRTWEHLDLSVPLQVGDSSVQEWAMTKGPLAENSDVVGVMLARDLSLGAEK